MRISVIQNVTRLPVTTTTFVFQPGNVQAFVNKNGVALVKLPKGEFSYTATTPGYPMVHGQKIAVATGVMRHIEIVLNKEAAVA